MSDFSPDQTQKNRFGAPSLLQIKNVTIEDGAGPAGLSGVLDTEGGCLSGLGTDAAFEGTAVTVLGSDTEDGTFTEVLDIDGNSQPITIGASGNRCWEPALFAGAPQFLKFQSTDVNFTADSVITARIRHA